MKKLTVVLTVMVAMIMISCSSTPEKTQEKKMTGIIKTFNPAAEMECYIIFGKGIRKLPYIEFSDGRYVYLQDMPDIQINKGDSIAIYYSEKENGCLITDSIIAL